MANHPYSLAWAVLALPLPFLSFSVTVPRTLRAWLGSGMAMEILYCINVYHWFLMNLTDFDGVRDIYQSLSALLPFYWAKLETDQWIWYLGSLRAISTTPAVTILAFGWSARHSGVAGDNGLRVSASIKSKASPGDIGAGASIVGREMYLMVNNGKFDGS
ncbi:hypothetical protein B0H34DRAFT_676975 [Crassisporium funariophilum]|nr:hypothetical protein B0H34DRAFT_676975 [Crassisporium funariophilum]